MTGVADMNSLRMPGHVIRRLHQRSTQVFAQRTLAAGLDLTSVQFAALDAIAAHPGADQATIAQLIAFDRATIGGVVDRLLQKGWIRRGVSPTDRRARVLDLTPGGQKILTQLLPVVEDLQLTLLENLSPAERDCFMALSRKILGNDLASTSVETAPAPVAESE
jgi:MarR family transcriptional regulator, temperature-dependent positive regulator of motility